MDVREVFPSISDKGWQAQLNRENAPGLKKCNSVVNLIANDIEPNAEALKNLQDNLLRERNIQLGDLINAGRIAMIFEIKNRDGKKINNAVLRIESSSSTGELDHPAFIQPIAQTLTDDKFDKDAKGHYKPLDDRDGYVATIVPLAKPLDHAPAAQDMKQIFAMLNTTGDLDKFKDIMLDQIMSLPGVNYSGYKDHPGRPAPIIVDLNTIATKHSPKEKMGDWKTFAQDEKNKMGEDAVKTIPNTVMDKSELENIRKQQDAYLATVKKELIEKNINIGPVERVPTTQSGVVLTPVNSMETGISY